MSLQRDEKTWGVGGVLGVGLGAIIGGSVFATMGPAVEGAGSGAPLAYVLGALPAYVTAYSYTRMATAHPGAGGTMAYFDLAFGGGYISASLNLLLVVCYASVASLYAGVFGVYVADLFHWHGPMAQRVMSCAGIVLVAVMNMHPAALSRRVQMPLNAAKFVIMGAFILLALSSPLWSWDNFSASHHRPLGSVLSTGLTIFMSYQGFELMAAIRKPLRSARRTLPVAMALCLGIVTLYYCGVAYCTVGNVNYATAGDESSYLLSAIARRILGEPGSLLLCAGAVIAAASAMNADVFSVSAIPEEMAEKREMPRYFLPRHPGARTLGVIFLCALLIIFVNVLSVEELTVISSLGFLGIYTLANVVAVLITHRTPTTMVICILGAATCAVSACIVAQQLFSGPDGVLLLLTAAGMLALPFIWQAAYYQLRRSQRRAR